MNSTIENQVILLLHHRAPNTVREDLFINHIIGHDEKSIVDCLETLEKNQRIKKTIDVRKGKAAPVNYYELPTYEGIPYRESINVGDVKVDRLLIHSAKRNFPEEFNEAIESLAKYNDSLEERFAELVKKEQRNYWSTIIGVFGIFVAILALIITGLPKIVTNSSMSFWEVVLANFAQLMPISFVLILFILLLRWLVR